MKKGSCVFFVGCKVCFFGLDGLIMIWVVEKMQLL